MSRFRTLLVAVALATSPLAVACSAETDDEAFEETDEQDVVSGRTVKLTEDNDGGTVVIKKGQSVALTLPSNASAGYAWQVAGTSRSLGQPKVTNLKPKASAPGSTGAQKFTWKTDGPFVGAGSSHTVTLEYRRSWQTNGPAEKTFTVTLDVVAPTVDATEADDGEALEVRTGQDVVLTLPSNGSTGYTWRVVSTSRSFGYPQEAFVAAAPAAVGSGGAQKFTWKTAGAFPLIGTQEVKLAYARSETGTPARTFTLLLDIR